VALSLFASHAAGAEHALFYVCYVCIVLVFAGYSVLRCLGRIGAGSMVPVCALFAWILSLLISLSAPSRRRRLFGLDDESTGTEPCEEGNAALWIALLLTTLPVLAPMPVVPFALFGQFVSLQHLIIGLVLPRPECSPDSGGPGGPLLGLPPIWASALQLSALAALLMAGQRRVERQRNVEKIIVEYLQAHYHQTNDFDREFRGNKQLAQNSLERIVNELEQEEQDCRRLLHELEELLPRSAHTARAWTSLTRHLAGTLGRCTTKLKHHSLDGDNATDQLFRAIEAGPQKNVDAEAVSAWLERSWSPRGFGSRRRKSSIARSDLLTFDEPGEDSHKSLAQSITSAGFNLGIGEWNFDAIKCDAEQHNVLQLVGFEILRTFSVLPKNQLSGFLENVERSYNAGIPYHSHIHGADMTNALFFLVKKTELWHLGGVAESTRAATMIAALGHDIGHFGRNNVFLTATRHKLAIRYNDRSVLENFHASVLVQLLDEEFGEHPEDRKKLLSGLPAEHLSKARQLMITLILGTDSQKHLDELSGLRVRMSATSFDPVGDDSDQQLCMAMLFRAADIGHSAKEWALHEEWSVRVVQEFHAQGDEERGLGLKVSPLCDRENFHLASSQVGFLQFVCVPTWKELANLEKCIKETSHTVLLNTKSAKSSASSLCSSSVRSRSNEHRNTIGNTLQMLAGAAHRNSTFLLLPGALPHTSSKMMPPAESLQRVQEVETPAPTRWVNDVCLAHCERNCQLWKSQTVARSESGVSDHVERRNGSPGRNGSPARTTVSVARTTLSNPESFAGASDNAKTADASGHL